MKICGTLMILTLIRILGSDADPGERIASPLTRFALDAGKLSALLFFLHIYEFR